VPSADDVPALPTRWLHDSEGDTGRFPRSSRNRSTSEASSSTPAASPRLHRRSSPWPPGRLSHRDREFPAPAQRSRVRTAASPYPPDLSWWAVKGRQTLVSRVHLLVTLTRPAPSGSIDASRRCQGCSHPHQHLLDQAALSFTQPLRRPGDEGLSPPFDFRRLVAHMVFRPVIAHENHKSSAFLGSLVAQPVSSPRITRRQPNGSVLEPARHPISAIGDPSNQSGHDLTLGIDHHSRRTKCSPTSGSVISLPRKGPQPNERRADRVPLDGMGGWGLAHM